MKSLWNIVNFLNERYEIQMLFTDVSKLYNKRRVTFMWDFYLTWTTVVRWTEHFNFVEHQYSKQNTVKISISPYLKAKTVVGTTELTKSDLCLPCW